MTLVCDWSCWNDIVEIKSECVQWDLLGESRNSENLLCAQVYPYGSSKSLIRDVVGRRLRAFGARIEMRAATGQAIALVFTRSKLDQPSAVHLLPSPWRIMPQFFSSFAA